jgi:hypothetical protein
MFPPAELAIRTHLTQPPHSVVVDARAHVHRYEAGGIAFHSQATTMPVVATNGQYITWDDIVPSLILDLDIHFCPTKLICLENTLQGMVMPQEEVVKISENAKERGIAMHVRLPYTTTPAMELPYSRWSPISTVRRCSNVGRPSQDWQKLEGALRTIRYCLSLHEQRSRCAHRQCPSRSQSLH